MFNITETLTNPPVAVAAGASTAITNTLVLTLPVVINVIMVIYLTVIVVHKCWQFYNEVKERRTKKRRLNDTAY